MSLQRLSMHFFPNNLKLMKTETWRLLSAILSAKYLKYAVHSIIIFQSSVFFKIPSENG